MRNGALAVKYRSTIEPIAGGYRAASTGDRQPRAAGRAWSA
jgi:hypothetical protein